MNKVQKLYNAGDFDFGLKPGSAAIDRGVSLPNVTDGFTGHAPDAWSAGAWPDSAALWPAAVASRPVRLPLVACDEIHHRIGVLARDGNKASPLNH